MFFEALMNSVAKSAINQVQVYEDEYMLDDTTGNKVGNGAALYKVIMRCTTLDTLSTNKALRDSIKDLPNHPDTLSGNVDSVHAAFFEAYNQLKARGSDVKDKEEILFAIYSQIPTASSIATWKGSLKIGSTKLVIWQARTLVILLRKPKPSPINSKVILTMSGVLHPPKRPKSSLSKLNSTMSSPKTSKSQRSSRIASREW
jgi:hypothetical protein